MVQLLYYSNFSTYYYLLLFVFLRGYNINNCSIFLNTSPKHVVISLIQTFSCGTIWSSKEKIFSVDINTMLTRWVMLWDTDKSSEEQLPSNSCEQDRYWKVRCYSQKGVSKIYNFCLCNYISSRSFHFDQTLDWLWQIQFLLNFSKLFCY